jgi:hypothetical protein
VQFNIEGVLVWPVIIHEVRPRINRAGG